MKKYLETGLKGSTTYQTLWEAAKAILRGTFMAINTYIKKKERSQITNFTLHLKEQEKEQTKPKVSRRKKIKIIAKIN